MSVLMVAWVRTALPRTGLPSPALGDRLMSGSWEHTKHYITSHVFYAQSILFVIIVARTNNEQRKLPNLWYMQV